MCLVRATPVVTGATWGMRSPRLTLCLVRATPVVTGAECDREQGQLI